MEPLERRFVSAVPIDLRSTLAIHRRGGGDPTLRFSRDGSAWRASLTPEGPVTMRLVAEGDGGRDHADRARTADRAGAADTAGRDDTADAARGTVIRAQAWGPGAAWAIEQAPELVGADEDPEAVRAFATLVAAAGPPLLANLLTRYQGTTIGRTRRVLEALVPAIIEQKVTGDEARAAFVALVRRHGQPAPGPWDMDRRPAPMRVPPAPGVLAGLPGYAYHPLGLERRRADAIRFAATRAARVEECADLPLADAYARLRALPLVGPWTAAEVGLRALGDADAVSVGDFHLAHAVCWALAGEERGTDERMLELLAPYAGHRARVIRLIESAGIREPRRGPRMAARSIAGI
jgi:3-methyladenine DNA glycosylase/8-oxoguanine DNA glycosylase